MKILLLALLACVGLPIDRSPDDTSETANPTDTSINPDCDRDDDQDGISACDDCDDSNPSRFPGAPEICNGIDDNCDDEIGQEETIDANQDGTADCQACMNAGFGDLLSVSDDELLNSIHALTQGTTCSYDSAREFMFQDLDNPTDEGATCVYTGVFYYYDPMPNYSDDNYDDVNTEHTWPQSQGADDEPAKCDLHHLFPTGAGVNSARNNHPFGEVIDITQTYTGGSLLGKNADGDTAFEPRAVHKGNVARAMLYFYATYPDQGYNFSADDLALFKSWSHQDPVDAVELQRTMDISEYQGHANPFVACLDLMDRLD